jgi:hypothetical protein
MRFQVALGGLAQGGRVPLRPDPLVRTRAMPMKDFDKWEVSQIQ